MGGILIFLMRGEEVRWRFCYAEVEVWGAAHLVLFVLWEMMSNRGIFERGVGRGAEPLTLLFFFCESSCEELMSKRGILVLLMEEGRA